MENNLEIERKFLVKGEFKSFAREQEEIAQGYLCSDPLRTVRVRIRGGKGYLTVKGPNHGVSRFEWEKEIPVSDARELLALAEPGVIEKTRYLVDVGRHTWEVDEFHGANEGLTLAEVELGAEDEEFIVPEWVGEEVSADSRYYNSYLKGHPFGEWK